MLARRQALLAHPTVDAALNEWWMTTDIDGNGEIDHDEYIELGKALYRVMIGDGNEAAARKSAESDWEDDRQGNEVMNGEQFKKAIFQ